MVESTAPTYLGNCGAVLDAFGYWPAFHDAPLLAFEHSPAPTAVVDLLVHVYELTRETDADGFFRTTKHHLIRFGFTDVATTRLEQFDVPNTLFALEFSPLSDFAASGRFTVRAESVMGGDCFATFSAASGAVSSVTPWNSDGHAKA